MKLYLSSFRVGDHGTRLVEMVGAGRRALVVINACDGQAPEEREECWATEVDALEPLGFRLEELDLRGFFDASDPAELGRLVRKADLLWVRGGNAFTLMRAVRASGLDAVLPPVIEEEAIVYGGYSAGIAILTPHLRGIDLVDDPSEAPIGYQGGLEWTGLGVLPFTVAPHYRSEHPESSDVERLVQHYIDTHTPFVALRDGEVLIRQDGAFEVLSRDEESGGQRS